MNSKVAFVLKLVGPNYLAWKRKMIDVLKSKNLWRFVNDEHKKHVDAKDVAVWEDKCDQARGLIGQTVADSFQVSVEAEDSPVEVWKTLSSLFDKSNDVSAYYLEKKIHELHLLILKEYNYILLN